MLKWKPLVGFHSVLSCFILKTGPPPLIILVGLELALFLLQPPQGWNYRHVSTVSGLQYHFKKFRSLCKVNFKNKR